MDAILNILNIVMFKKKEINLIKLTNEKFETINPPCILTFSISYT